jgi:sensor c-di-GMP phosphodiesterase-like protein
MEVDDILDSNFIEYLTLLTQIHDIDNSKINFELVETEDIPNELKDIIISKIKQLSDM